MPRAVSGKIKHQRTKKILKLAKGYRGARSKQYRTAIEAVMKAGLYAYRDRRAKKRDFRRLWIARINAGAREYGMSYSTLVQGLKKAGIIINRKFLSDLATKDTEAFKAIVDKARAAL